MEEPRAPNPSEQNRIHKFITLHYFTLRRGSVEFSAVRVAARVLRTQTEDSPTGSDMYKCT